MRYLKQYNYWWAVLQANTSQHQLLVLRAKIDVHAY